MPYSNLSVAEEKLFKELLKQSEFSIGDVVVITKSGGNDSNFPGYPLNDDTNSLNSLHKVALMEKLPLTGYIDEIYLNTMGRLSFKIKRFDSEDEYYVVRGEFVSLANMFTRIVETIKKELNE